MHAHDGSSRRYGRRFLSASVVALVALTSSSCIPPPPDDDVMRTFDPEDTVMGVIQERGTLVVGVQEGSYPLAEQGGATGTESSPAWDGMAVRLAQEVADSLGVELEVEARPDADALLAAITDDEVDIAFPVLPVTEERVKSLRPTHSFTDPYLVAHQRIAVPADEGASAGLEELDNRTVCSFADADTGVDLSAIADVTEELDTAEGCSEKITSVPEPQVGALSGPDFLLAGLVERSRGGLTIVGDQLNTEGYSAVVEAGASAWTQYVDQVLEEAQQEGRWTEYFDEWLAPGLGSQDPPGMSVEEAAALFPADL